ncbi:hypothetical protein I3760_16G019800 [Carya illinoinensis]|nr:hypothetical protein I3760_16G019800 [Carya illinoinensis]
MEAVYDNSRKGGMHYPVAFIAMLILLLLGANSCSGGAAVGIQLVKSNTTFRCDGRLDECLVEDDFELELLINPYISRSLGKQGKGHTTDISGKRGILTYVYPLHHSRKIKLRIPPQRMQYKQNVEEYSFSAEFVIFSSCNIPFQL